MTYSTLIVYKLTQTTREDVEGIVVLLVGKWRQIFFERSREADERQSEVKGAYDKVLC